jgi:hypothetical protein
VSTKASHLSHGGLEQRTLIIVDILIDLVFTYREDGNDLWKAMVTQLCVFAFKNVSVQVNN